jgi:hypothetical protein
MNFIKGFQNMRFQRHLIRVFNLAFNFIKSDWFFYLKKLNVNNYFNYHIIWHLTKKKQYYDKEIKSKGYKYFI